MNDKKARLVFTKQLLLWHNKHNDRQMPWKGEKDPYKIWLSEIILQQTRVEQGLQYYLRFIAAYPTVQLLAAAEDTAIFKLWEGLGYYSRCKNLLASARFIVDFKGGVFPDNYAELLQLKGVGPYTAAAIASFAYNLPHAVVDGNVNRVLSRFFNINTPIDSTIGKVQFASLANDLLDIKNAASYNQAIMDFGAMICKPMLPLCDACVLQKNCRAYEKNRVNTLPVKEKKIVKKVRWFYYIMAEYENKLLIRKRTEKDIWQNLHEFILIESDSPQTSEHVIASEAFNSVAGKSGKLVKVSATFKQQLTHQTIHASFFRIKQSKKITPEGVEWIAKENISSLAFPKLINNYLQGEFIEKAV
jgi:A/G-specific adenine glycosylase